MNVDIEIKRLNDIAMEISQIEDQAERFAGGKWLNQQLVNLHDSYMFSQNQLIDFMVVIRILFELIFENCDLEESTVA